METIILGLYVYIYIHPISPFLGTLNIRCRPMCHGVQGLGFGA